MKAILISRVCETARTFPASWQAGPRMSTEFIWKLWNNQYGLDQDNFYANLLRSSKSLLDFEVPRGLRCSFTSLPTANFANSHRLTVFPTIGGSLSFLHTSRPFTGFQRTKTVPLTEFVEGYRMIREYTPPGEDCDREVWQGGKRVDAKDTLMFGRLHLPYKKLEAIYARRLSATRQLILSCTSDPTLLNGGAAFAQLQQDMGKYSVEYVYHTDDALIGCRTLWNFGPDPRTAGLDDLIEQDNLVSPNAEGLAEARDLPLSAYGKFSAGAEIYYGALYKSGGGRALFRVFFMRLTVSICRPSLFHAAFLSRPSHDDDADGQPACWTRICFACNQGRQHSELVLSDGL